MRRAEDFWSRRKVKVREEEAVEARAAETRLEAVRERAAETRPDDEILSELGLPDPDTLTDGDDFAAFMSRAVPERIRRRALRRLWRCNAALANLDGLVEYGEDYTDSACVVEGMQTAYRVGKGMLAHLDGLANGPDTPVDAGEGSAEDAEGDTVPAVTSVGHTPATMAAAGADGESADTDADAARDLRPAADPGPDLQGADPAPEATLPRRRMQFRFQDQSGGFT